MNTVSARLVKVLLVDDDEDDFLLTSDYLRETAVWDFKIEWAKNFNEALERIKQRCHDLYFFDYLLGSHTGLQLLQEVVRLGFEAPVVLLTGKGDRSIDEEAMRLGAADYLVKDELDAEKLERCVRYALDRAASLKTLRESESKYRNLFEQSQDMIYISTTEGTFTYLNSSAVKLTGYPLNELFRMKGYELYENPGDRALFEEALEGRGEVRDFEFTLVTKSGERRICLVTASALEDSSGRYYQGVVHDITVRKRAERDLLMAEKLAATGRLVRTLAHEVRNPLTNINLSVEQMETEQLIDDQQFYLNIIQRNSQRINDLITELLNSAKPTEMILQTLSVQHVMDDTLRQAEDRMALKNIGLTKKYGEDAQLQLDKPKIEIAFLNIIMNAVEAMEENTGMLTISIDCADSRSRITITDNGTGISKENISRLFEPYFTSKNNGIGLGLAATLNIIQSHQGAIEVESEEGVGTTFIVSFPVD
ncbi:MAG: PAS domain S-box protein [Cytophagaceae bacterium]|nr:PAS domain S-box protein [Cytophagaceae bacterium]